MTLPIARTIVLTDAGTVPYSPELAAYDGTAAGAAPTIGNTLAGSARIASTVAGLPALFAGLYARRDAIAAQTTAQRTRRLALATRIASLES